MSPADKKRRNFCKKYSLTEQKFLIFMQRKSNIFLQNNCNTDKIFNQTQF